MAGRSCCGLFGFGILHRKHADVATFLPLVLEKHYARDAGEKRIVLAAADIFPGFIAGAALAYQNAAAGDELPSKTLDSQSLAVGIASINR